MVVVYSFLAPEFHILKPQTTFAYRFNHTLNDLVWSSWVRTFLALASHAASRRENVYFPYLLVSSILLVVCGIHASLKAVYFQYAEDEVDKTIAPLMFAITITACVAHVLVAASMRVHARKTLKRQAATRAGVLGFRFSESGALQGMDGSYGFDSQGDDGNLNSDGRRSPRGQQMMQSPLTPGFDFDADVPADRLIDRDSKFATIRGVRVHYKDSYKQGQTQNGQQGQQGSQSDTQQGQQLDNQEQNGENDNDGDGIPDDLDTDDDNDGIPDLVDDSPNDHDNDGIDDAEDNDDDGDGLNDDEEVNDGNDNTDIYDHDNDGIQDRFDLDIDNDGIDNYKDFYENGSSAMRDHDNDGLNDGNDTDDDNDNILDVDEVGGAWSSYRYDHDNDNIWDASDLDDDNDGLSDWFEQNDGNDATGQFDSDNDGDGILDELEG